MHDDIMSTCWYQSYTSIQEILFLNHSCHYIMVQRTKRWGGIHYQNGNNIGGNTKLQASNLIKYELIMLHADTS